MTNERVETVLIKGGKDGPVRVNKSDYEADQAEGGAKSMKLHKDEDDNAANAKAPATAGTVTLPEDPSKIPPAPGAPNLAAAGTETTIPAGPVPPTVPSPNGRSVAKLGKKWFVVDGSGEKLTEFPGIVNSDGYATEDEAMTVLRMLPR